MSTTSITHLFPPEAIHQLPSWRFVLHFVVPHYFRRMRMKSAYRKLGLLKCEVVSFSPGFDRLEYDRRNNTVAIPIEVIPELRQRPDALQKYESDFWRICALMVGCRFGDLFYEAIDWKDN